MRFHDPAVLAFSLSFWNDAVMACPCDELRFVPDETARRFVRSLASDLVTGGRA